MATLVFDIGGTRTRVGLYDSRHSKIIRSASAATPNHLDLPELSFEGLRDGLLSLMRRLGDELVEQPAVREVDVAFAGPIDPAGNVLAAPTLWGARLTSPYPLGQDIARCWPNARVRILNDVTAAGYRYLRSSGDDFCIVTVSSGIGNKVFANGRPLVGRNGLGGELGHLRVDDSEGAPICECGGRGHLGAVSSGRAVLAYARKHAPQGSCIEGLTSGDLVAAFRREEPWAMRIVERGAGPLGWALAAMHLGLGIERFVLVGGFALALGDVYRQLVAGAANARCWDAPGGWDSRVELGVNDDLSGLIGAGIAGMVREGSV
jgi:predicted NBD/HSP70 family sugar kinase